MRRHYFLNIWLSARIIDYSLSFSCFSKYFIPNWIIYHNNKIYYVEFFGLIRNKLYKQGALQKIEDCKKNNIDLIAIYPKDLKNKSLEEIFSFLN